MKKKKSNNNMVERTLTQRLITKLVVAFTLLVVLMGVSYIFITVFFTNMHIRETSQKLNVSLAQDLINEKFRQESPFLEDGSVNTALFGDLMHDMMAVNPSIEVYLLDEEGTVLYSVVLDHNDPETAAKKVSLEPIDRFIASEGNGFIMGDDPRNPGQQNIFSAAQFNQNGREGYIYIILAGQVQEQVNESLFAGYFMKLGLVASLLTMVFVLIIGFLSIWFLTNSLRSIVYTVKRFREGDLNIRVSNPDKSDLSVLANTFNDMADTIVKNMEEIKSIDSLRRELIANVSHDLRTPLSILKGYVETLQMKQDELSEKEKENYLDIIHDSSLKLSNLVTQLFEYSKLEAKQIEPKKEPFAITDLALDLIANFQVIAAKKNIEIKLEAARNLPLVFADISLVERAIQNLMDNALKYTPEGGKVTLQITPFEKNVEVIISDTGPGIKESEQPYIFERYRQTKRTVKSDGVGLGLAIVKKILELHDSTIRVISKPNQGSSFHFYLPCYSG